MPVKLSEDEMQALLIECRRQQAFAGVLPESARAGTEGLDGVNEEEEGGGVPADADSDSPSILKVDASC